MTPCVRREEEFVDAIVMSHQSAAYLGYIAGKTLIVICHKQSRYSLTDEILEHPRRIEIGLELQPAEKIFALRLHGQNHMRHVEII
jgi:hypothetical protein